MIQEFLNSPAGSALIALVGVAFADFLTGSFAALRDGTFAIDSLAAFLRKHIWGRVAPIGTLLVLGYFGGGTIGALFLTSAIAAATAYAAETAGSILDNVKPPQAAEELTSEEKAAGFTLLASPVNPVPKD